MTENKSCACHAEGAPNAAGGTAQISHSQAYVLLILARLLHTMIYFHGEMRMGAWILASILISTAIETLLCLPLLALLSRFGGVGELIRRSPVYGFLCAAFFLFLSSGSVTHFTRFMQTEFPQVLPPVAVMLVTAAAAVYCSCLGVQALARAGTIVFAAFAVLLVSMALVSEAKPDMLNMIPVTEADMPDLWRMVLHDLSSSRWLVMLPCLAPGIRDVRTGAKKTAAAYLVTKLVILELLAALTILLLGNFVRIIGYPILAIGAYARTDFIRHFDAVNMFVWSLNCILVNGVYIFLAASKMPAKSPSKPNVVGAVICGAVVFAAAYASYGTGLDYNSNAANAVKGAAVLALGVAAPAISLVHCKLQKRRKEACKEG